jgi:flagellar capping protein FliD
VNGIKDGLALPFKNTGNDLQQRLATVGIKTETDDTLRVDEAELKKALTINNDGVRDIFNNPDTGLLPRLETALAGILKKSVGDLDLKRDEVLIHANIPSALAEKFQRFVDNATLRNKIQNLIAVA